MSRLYTTQDFFSIELSYDDPIVGTIDNVKIKYKAPDTTTGAWDAVHDSQNQIIKYQSTPGNPLGIAGRWTVWSFVTFTDGSVLPGSKFKFLVKPEIPE